LLQHKALSLFRKTTLCVYCVNTCMQFIGAGHCQKFASLRSHDRLNGLSARAANFLPLARPLPTFLLPPHSCSYFPRVLLFLTFFLIPARSTSDSRSYSPRALAPPLSLTFAFHLQKNLTLVGISLGCSLSLSPFSFALPLRLLFVFPSRIPRDSPLSLSFPCLTCARFPSLVFILVSPPPRLTIYYVFEYNIIDRSIFIWCVLLIIT